MVSRDTVVHLGALALALSVVGIATYFELGTDTGTTAIALFLVFYGLVLGGAHLYLAIRGVGGMVPVEARWRFLALVAILLGVGTVVLAAGDRTVLTLDVSTIGFGVGILAIVGYFLTESVAGYRASRSG